jgi:hypothetical protein
MICSYNVYYLWMQDPWFVLAGSLICTWRVFEFYLFALARSMLCTYKAYYLYLQDLSFVLVGFLICTCRLFEIYKVYDFFLARSTRPSIIFCLILHRPLDVWSCPVHCLALYRCAGLHSIHLHSCSHECRKVCSSHLQEQLQWSKVGCDENFTFRPTFP